VARHSFRQRSAAFLLTSNAYVFTPLSYQRKAAFAGAIPGAGGCRFLDEIMNDCSDEETNDPLVADVRNFYKVEKWTRDGEKVDSLLYAGNNLDKTRDIFATCSYLRSH
jgi:hypothetical protein